MKSTNLNRFLRILLCFLIATPSLLNANSEQTADSLKQVIETGTGRDRMNSMILYYEVKKTDPETLTYYQFLADRAEKKGEWDVQSKAYFILMNHYYARAQVDSVKHYVDKIKKVNKISPQEDYFSSIQAICQYLMIDGHYELVLQEVNELLTESAARNDALGQVIAYQIMGVAHIYLRQLDEGIKVLKEGLIIAETVTNEDYLLRMHLNRSNLHCHIAEAYGAQGNYEQALAHADSMIVCINTFEKEYTKKTKLSDASAHLDHYYFNAYAGYANYLIELGRLDEASAALETFKKYAESPIIPSDYLKAMYNYSLALYNYKIGNYSNALELAYTSMESTKKSFFPQYVYFLKLKSEILAAEKKYPEAIDSYKQLIDLKDSTARADMHKQIVDLKSVHRVNQLEQEAVEKQLQLRIIYIVSISLTLICILLAILIVYSRKVAREQREKNQTLYEQLKEQDRYKEVLKETQSKQTQSAPKSDSLFSRIEKYLDQTQCYLDPDITREALAAKMGTNYKYLVDAIKEATNMTFNDYISDYRLEHARRLITQENEDRTIQMIYLESGFNNKNTFSRLFVKKYGMRPSELRALAKNEV
ncbi:MAG: helix-turn-helix domain-containing protein [Dysgonomonas sp.]|nr:helix-turn-helix domain-containing protein [Dysgonomonas sp.]